MARTIPKGFPPVGPAAYTRDDSGRDKPSWFSLGGYFQKKGRGNKGSRSSSSAQQKASKGNRGKQNE